MKPVAIHIGLRRVVDDSYDILIGIPLARAIEDIVRISGGGKAFVITDTNVARRYARAVDRSLRVRGNFRTFRHWSGFTICRGRRCRLHRWGRRIYWIRLWRNCGRM